MARPREEDSEQENPRNLKPILILAESNNNDFKVLDTPERDSILISVPLGNKMNKVHPTNSIRDHNAYGRLS